MELRALLFWVRDRFKQTEATLAQAADQVLCRAHTWSTKTGEMFQVSPGRFLQRQGDVVYDVTCKEVRVPLREMEQCFREIPIQHEDYKFIDPHHPRTSDPGDPQALLGPLSAEGSRPRQLVYPGHFRPLFFQVIFSQVK